MTKDELEKEATEYALEWGDKTDGTYACSRDGYLAGAEPREKRIADLEWQLKEITEDNDYWQKENEELKKENAQAKEIIEELYYIIPASISDYVKEPMERAKKFVNKVK